MARIYAVTSVPTNVVTSTGDRVYLRDIPSYYLDLKQSVRSRGARHLDLQHNLHVFARSGYEVWLKNLSTSAETNLGFIPATGPLQLAGVNIADGSYEIEVRLSGYFWKNARPLKRFPVKISGGVAVTPLPTPRNLSYSYNLNDTQLSWNWLSEIGTNIPDDFAIWTSLIDPVNTAGAPNYVVAATVPTNYSTNIVQGATVLYVAVCARKAGVKGSFATLEIPVPPADLTSPDNQIVKFPQ